MLFVAARPSLRTTRSGFVIFFSLFFSTCFLVCPCEDRIHRTSSRSVFIRHASQRRRHRAIRRFPACVLPAVYWLRWSAARGRTSATNAKLARCFSSPPLPPGILFLVLFSTMIFVVFFSLRLSSSFVSYALVAILYRLITGRTYSFSGFEKSVYVNRKKKLCQYVCARRYVVNRVEFV